MYDQDYLGGVTNPDRLPAQFRQWEQIHGRSVRGAICATAVTRTKRILIPRACDFPEDAWYGRHIQKLLQLMDPEEIA